MSDTTSAVSYELDGDVAVVRIDDGKANALSNAVIDDLFAALERAEREAKAVVLLGRPGRFCAGFDLSVMNAGPEAVQALVGRGAELCLRLFMFPRPVVIGCTGHALAAGAIMLMSADVRLGAAGDFKLGLNEVAIGMPLPRFLTELARERLSRRWLTAATALATIFGPEGARDAGYLDEVVAADALEATARERAATLAATLNQRAFAASRAPLRGAVEAAIRADLAEDLSRFFVDR